MKHILKDISLISLYKLIRRDLKLTRRDLKEPKINKSTHPSESPRIMIDYTILSLFTKDKAI